MTQARWKTFRSGSWNLFNVKDPTLQIQFFTNRSGTLFVQGLESGDYRVKLLGDEFAR